MLQKTFHIKPHNFYAFSYSFSDEYANKINRDSVNKSLRQLLEKINKAGLLTNRVYTYTLKSIDSSRYIADIQIIDELAEMSSRLEWLAPDRLLPVAEELHKNDIVSDSSFLRLKGNISSGKIESAFQLNDYCKLDRTFDLTKYAGDPDVWLEQFHRDMALTMPGLTFTNFSYTATPDSSIVHEIKFKVTLTCNGHIYKQSSVVLNYRNKQGKLIVNDLFTQTFYRIFNKILADEQSPFRLHLVMFRHTNGAYDERHHFSLIGLTEEQAEVFMKEPCRYYMLVSSDNYDNTLTSARVDTTIEEWKRWAFLHIFQRHKLQKQRMMPKQMTCFRWTGCWLIFRG